MKQIIVFFIVLVSFAFSSSSNHIISKSKVCEKSEKGFWKAIHKFDINAKQSLNNSEEGLNQKDDLISTRAGIQMHFNEVEILCKTLDKDIETTYQIKMKEIQTLIDSL